MSRLLHEDIATDEDFYDEFYDDDEHWDDVDLSQSMEFYLKTDQEQQSTPISELIGATIAPQLNDNHHNNNNNRNNLSSSSKNKKTFENAKIEQQKIIHCQTIQNKEIESLKQIYNEKIQSKQLFFILIIKVVLNKKNFNKFFIFLPTIILVEKIDFKDENLFSKTLKLNQISLKLENIPGFFILIFICFSQKS